MRLPSLPSGFGDAYSLDFYGNYIPTWSEVQTKWQTLLTNSSLLSIKQKFNWTLVRLQICFKNLENAGALSQQIDTTNADGTLTILDNVIALLASNGYKVMIGCWNYTGTSPSTVANLKLWKRNWKVLATRYANNKNIFAFQIGNEMEPFQKNTDGTCTQEATLLGYETLNQAMASCTDEIRKSDSQRTVVWCPELSFDTIVKGGGKLVLRPNTIKDMHFANYIYAMSGGKRISCTGDAGCPTGFYCTPEGNGVCATCMPITQEESMVNYLVSQRSAYAIPYAAYEVNQSHSIGGIVGKCVSNGSYLMSYLIQNQVPYIAWCLNEDITNWTQIMNGV